MILKNLTLPNGVEATVHRVTRVEINDANGVVTVLATVASWPSQAMHDSGAPPGWVEYVTVPLTALGGAPLGALDAYLASVGQYLEGGAAVASTHADLGALKARKWAEIKAHRDVAESAPFMWNGRVYDADAKRINGAATLALIAASQGVEFTETWTLHDNTRVTLTGPDILALGAALARHVSGVHEYARGLRDAIEAAETPEALAAIQWTYTPTPQYAPAP